MYSLKQEVFFAKMCAVPPGNLCLRGSDARRGSGVPLELLLLCHLRQSAAHWRSLRDERDVSVLPGTFPDDAAEGIQSYRFVLFRHVSRRAEPRAQRTGPEEEKL